MIKRKTGAVLVITLLLAVVATLFLAAAVKLLPTLGRSNVNLQKNEQALQAAQSGLDYARSRLQANPAWRGDENGLVVDTPELKVLEDNGNVFGFLTPPDAPPSHFRFRFNHQNDGDTPSEGLEEPTNYIRSQYVSYNNLRSSARMEQYRAHPVSGRWQVDDDSDIANMIPKFTAAIIVEGYAGDQVRNLSPVTPVPVAALSGESRVILEAYLARPGFLAVDSAVMAASEFNADLIENNGTLSVQSDESATPPRVRTLSDMEVYSSGGSANYVTPSNGQVIVDIGQEFSLNGTPSTSPEASEETEAEQSPHWLKLGYDDITRAQPTDANVRAGTYVWKAGGTLEYFPVEYDGTNVPTGSGTIITSGDQMLASGSNAIDLTASNFRMRIKDNIFVAPQAGGSVTGFTVIADTGLIASAGRRPETILNHTEDKGVVFSNDSGQVFLEGKIDGGGAVTAAGDITFQGTSTLEAEPQMAVALYSKEDINLRAIPNEVHSTIAAAADLAGGGGKGKGGKGKGKGGKGKGNAFGHGGGSPGFAGSPFAQPRDVAFGGIIFAQKNFNVDLRESTTDPLNPLVVGGNNHGRFYLKGMLATFGGDPATDNAPGEEAGSGVLNLVTSEAIFIYDPDYLDSMVELNAPTRLEKSFWTTL